MHIAQNPENKVTPIFDLSAAPVTFQPMLTAVPPDWTLSLSHPVATPSISLGTGTYVGSQEVTITDSTAGNTIYYTIDGAVPTSSSTQYSGALLIGITSTVQAIAVLGISQSSVASSTLTITNTTTGTKLAFLQQPSNTSTQTVISPAVTVAVEDAKGNIVSSASNPVKLTLAGSTANLGGTLSVVPMNGIATFSNLTIGTAGSAYALSATSAGLAPATSARFNVTAPAGTTATATQLAFLQQPSNASTQAPISPAVTVAVEDAKGNVVSSANNPVKLTLAGSTVSLGGTLSSVPVNGIATFSNLTLGTAGNGYALSATSAGLASATSARFNVTAPAGTGATATRLAFLQQPTNSLTQAPISPALTVAVEDANGDVLTGGSYTVSLALNSDPSALNGGSTQTTVNGVATFSGLSVIDPGAYLLNATSGSLSPAASTSFTVTSPPAQSVTYYLSPSGSDSNGGTLRSPWLTPNHSVNCGDVLVAQEGTYPSNAFSSGWGTVTCPAGNNVAWVRCATFDACKIFVTSGDGMEVNASYWGVSGFEVDGNPSSGVCFFAILSSAANVHHIIFANNVAIGCGGGGIAASPNGTHGVDYLVVIGNIIHATAGGSPYCGSGISVYEPVAYDTLPGTHIYIAGNESDGNFNPSTCGGAAPTDGNGLIIDTLDGSQSGGNIPPYTPQVVVENNLLIANGGRGLSIYNNATGTAPFGHVYARYNTLWGNNRDTNQSAVAFKCAEELLDSVDNVEVYNSIAMGAQSTGCHAGTETIYAVSVYGANATDLVYQTVAYAASGSTTSSTDSTGFTYGPNNVLGANPSFVNPIIPSTPSCGTYANVSRCIAKIVGDFMPTSAGVSGFGYQAPSATPIYNPLYPQWLCNVILPAGLVTSGCGSSSALSSGYISGIGPR
jgi:hypothetical protein